MAGTVEGGRKAARTNRERHGKNFYQRIGAEGGRKGTTGGFASNAIGCDGLTGPQRARIAGAKGGRMSRRPKAEKQKQ